MVHMNVLMAVDSSLFLYMQQLIIIDSGKMTLLSQERAWSPLWCSVKLLSARNYYLPSTINTFLALID